ASQDRKEKKADRIKDIEKHQRRGVAMTDHAELRRLAKAATPGPWTLYVPEDYQGPEELPGYGVECAEGRAIVWGALEPETGCQFDRDAEFIAAANPNTILALLDEIDQLKAENCAHKDTQKHCELLEQYLKECASALPGTYYMDPPDGGNVSIPEQIRRMAKDAARYRWLIASAWYVGPEPKGDTEAVSWHDHNDTMHGVTTAIDAAIEGAKQ
ncbi:TPA: ead/Ea22-like family protein, partial [Pseudomonas aeruginosa]|nr:ead/Ea22-like family protein [Pseudomonas aeruginosa]